MMRWTRMENPLFFIKRGPAYYTVLGIVLVVGGLFSAADARVELISYVSNQTGNFDIHIMDTHGKYLDNLTDHSADEFDPTWSPDGRFLSYVSNRDGNAEIYVMDTRTKEHRRLTHTPGTDSRPTWSPDGRWIAFVSDRRGSSDIYKMDANGENIRQLTKIGNNGSPAWSPDGQWILFFSQSDQRFNLYVMTSEGRELRLLIPAKLRDPLPIAWDVGYTWSPDGKQIAFGTWEFQLKPKNFALGVPAEALPLLENPKPRVPVTISVFDMDVGKFRKLMQVPQGRKRQSPPILQISRPAWSPNGDRIAYSISDVGKQREFSADLHIINVRNNDRVGRPLVKTGGGKFYLSPVWVPKGFLSISPSSEKQTTLRGKEK